MERKVSKFRLYQNISENIIKTASYNRSLTLDQIAVIIAVTWLTNIHLLFLFILTFDWLMEGIQIFLKLDSLFKAKLNVRAKTIQFLLNLDSWQKLIKNRSVGNIGFWCSYIKSSPILIFSLLFPVPRDPNPVFSEKKRCYPNSTSHFTYSDSPQNKNMTHTARESNGK